MPSTKTQNDWNKENRVNKTVTFSKISDQDILAHIQSVPSFQGYVKDLIREDIRKSNQSKT